MSIERIECGAGGFYPALYARIVTYSGVGAAFFHASLTDWGGKLDLASMVLSFGFWLMYNVTRVFAFSQKQFTALFLGLAAALLVPRVVFGILGFEIFAGLVAAVLLSEVLVARNSLRVQRHGMREFQIRDCSGNVLRFGQEAG
jgi:hypothetical protein